MVREFDRGLIETEINKLLADAARKRRMFGPGRLGSSR